MKPGIKEYNKKSIVFDNGSAIRVSATTKNAFRGRALNLLICDELAFVPPNQANDFWSSNFPTISKSKDSKVVLISTPKGQHNLFHRL
ncbi:MAG: terminase large subunit domain-containing protein [archaeon]